MKVLQTNIALGVVALLAATLVATLTTTTAHADGKRHNKGKHLVYQLLSEDLHAACARGFSHHAMPSDDMLKKMKGMEKKFLKSAGRKYRRDHAGIKKEIKALERQIKDDMASPETCKAFKMQAKKLNKVTHQALHKSEKLNTMYQEMVAELLPKKRKCCGKSSCPYKSKKKASDS